MSEPGLDLEAAAEAVVFAHEAEFATTAPAAHPDVPALERTAALAAAAFARGATVPKTLQQRLAADGLAFCAERTQRSPSTAARRAFPWPLLTALAAGVALWFALRSNAIVDRAPVDLRAELIASDTAAKQLPWRAGPSPMAGQVQGDVVWSADRQAGYLRFRGLPPLDAAHRYQLWIVDGRREGAPVDGGLFAIGEPGSETVVPIRPTLPIGDAKAFVVTVEAQHGAVVSKQEHVVAIASL